MPSVVALSNAADVSYVQKKRVRQLIAEGKRTMSSRTRVGTTCLETVSGLGARIGVGRVGFVVAVGGVCKIKHPLRLLDFIQ